MFLQVPSDIYHFENILEFGSLRLKFGSLRLRLRRLRLRLRRCVCVVYHKPLKSRAASTLAAVPVNISLSNASLSGDDQPVVGHI